jgi:putative Ca2+/H+ antiporter (TMEM165/GDT1 family)
MILPGAYLELLTGLLFLVFAAMLIRSAPDAGNVDAEPNGGVIETGGEQLDVRVPILNWQVPHRLGGFPPIFVLMAVGEFGDRRN